MITPDIHICSYIVIQQDPFDGVSFDMEILVKAKILLLKHPFRYKIGRKVPL